VALVACGLLALTVLRGDTEALGSNWRRTWVIGTALAGGLIGYLGVLLYQGQSGYRVVDRNFYGGLKVSDEGDGSDRYRKLTHGTINHGVQYLSGSRRRQPTTYYGDNSGVAKVVRAAQERGPVRIGVIGLGTGTMAAFGRPGDVVRFYEINPLVEKLARSEFTYLAESKGKVDVVMGDARLSLEREPPQNYDVLAVDAFSSDAIPIHLLTREAVDLYFRHLSPGGVLAVHVSNRYLALEPVVKRIADVTKRYVRNVDSSDVHETGEYGSTWVLVTESPTAFKNARVSDADDLKDAPLVRLWTDDYSNLFQILK
jgi:spermidine synthase